MIFVDKAFLLHYYCKKIIPLGLIYYKDIFIATAT